MTPIRLTYRGQLRTGKNREDIWAMRLQFHSQLEKLWNKYPFEFLKEWEEKSHFDSSEFSYSVNNCNFVSFFSDTIGIGVNLEILVLSGNAPQAATISHGDLDNRFKRVIDALRAVSPKNKQEMPANVEIPDRVYCLMNDDKIIREIKAELGLFLDSNGPTDSFVMITVKPYAIRALTKTFHLAV